MAVTISAGVAEMGPGVHDLKGLLDNADAAMYEAKAAGRDQVKSHQG
ncbi:MAG: diguanylate cyclase [Acidimicrobiia bacterium]|nr:diguanylate cyclase [Acidimicrobiia bacterium]